jgi:hypothetical protein
MACSITVAMRKKLSLSTKATMRPKSSPVAKQTTLFFTRPDKISVEETFSCP